METTLDLMLRKAAEFQAQKWANMTEADKARSIWIEFLARHTVCRYGTGAPARYALVREYAADGTPEKHLPVVGPLRSTRKAALAAGWKQYLSENGK